MLNLRYSLIRTSIVRVLSTWLAAHAGALVGEHCYIWCFSPVNTVMDEYISEWSGFLWQIVDPRTAIGTLEFAMISYKAPKMLILLVSCFIAWSICIGLRRWRALMVTCFFSFAALKFFGLLAWKTG